MKLGKIENCSIICFVFLIFFVSPLYALDDKSANSDDVIDLKTIPRLRAGLPEGTIAWATPDQLHPTQPQTGKREVEKKVLMFTKAMNSNKENKMKNFIKLATKQMAPAYIAKTPISDGRFGREPVLGYITDRTHGSNALSELYLKVYGPEALINPIYDKKGRPLNYILVKVIGDKSNLSEKEFQDFMLSGNHAYLEKWSRGNSGETVIEKISFDQLPEKVLQTSDNPWRAFVGELQHDGLPKVAEDYSQFSMAKKLNASGEITWDDITGKEKKYDLAKEKALKFFKKNPYNSCSEYFLKISTVTLP